MVVVPVLAPMATAVAFKNALAAVGPLSVIDPTLSRFARLNVVAVE